MEDVIDKTLSPASANIDTQASSAAGAPKTPSKRNRTQPTSDTIPQLFKEFKEDETFAKRAFRVF